MPTFERFVSRRKTAASKTSIMSAPAIEEAALAVTHHDDYRLTNALQAAPIESPTACQCTLAIPELLEGILLQLPPRQVLVMQRVHTIFKNCVKESPKLRERLYLRAKETLPLNNQHLPLKSQVNDVLFFESSSNSNHYIFHISRMGLTGGEVGAMGCRVYPKEDSTYLQAWDVQGHIYDLLKIGFRSYSKMYLTDFPTADIEIEIWNTDLFQQSSDLHLWNRAGLRIKWTTFDMVVEAMQSLREAAEQWGRATDSKKRRFDWKKYFRDPVRQLVLLKPHIPSVLSSYG